MKSRKVALAMTLLAAIAGFDAFDAEATCSCISGGIQQCEAASLCYSSGYCLNRQKCTNCQWEDVGSCGGSSGGGGGFEQG